MTDLPVAARPPVQSATHHVETVLWVRHWTDRLFSFALTRPPALRMCVRPFALTLTLTLMLITLKNLLAQSVQD